MKKERHSLKDPIVDGHSHIGAPPDWMAPENFVRILDEAGISHAVVCRFLPGKNSLDSNQLTYKIVKEYPKRLIGCFWVNPTENDAKLQIKRAIEDWGFGMVKVHFGVHKVSEKNILEVSRMCEQLGVPLFVDIKQNFKLLDALLSSTDIPVVLAHLGTGVYDLNVALLSKSLLRARGHKNLMLDTSGTTYPLLKQALDQTGPDQLVFGSDAPHEHPGVALGMIEYLGLPVEDFKKICAGNIQKILPK